MTKSSLGRSLEKKHTPKRVSKTGFVSVLEESQIDDLVKYCAATEDTIVFRDRNEASSFERNSFKPNDASVFVTLPRKPSWKGLEGNSEEYQKLEEKEFYRWRAQLARLEESNSHLIMTPFERSLDIWRELWKAVEKANVLVQILDARNPLFFYSPDLFKYSTETKPSTRHLVILNKADLLTDTQQNAWEEYFKSVGISVLFFTNADTEMTSLGSRICSPASMIEKLKNLMPEGSEVVSFVGYPNVGKSSTLNSLLNRHNAKAAVSATPGKTKHIQTFETESFTICDCPGLVFPNMAMSKAELLLNGVLSIDNMREYLEPVELMANRIQISSVEKLYNIKIQVQRGISLAESILAAYALSRGMFTSNFGNPDMSRAARIILKDYVSGSLLYCYPPPGKSDQEFNNLVKENHSYPEEAIVMPGHVASTGYGIKDSKTQQSSSGKKHFKMNKRR